MAFLRMGLRAAVLVGLGAAWLQAQTTRVHVIVAPQGRPRMALITPPPPPPPPQPLATDGPTVFSSYPLIITPDGRVLVDLGNGYMEVARTCPYAYGYACQSYSYPTAPQSYPPAYAPPVYPVPTYPQTGVQVGTCGGYSSCVVQSRRPLSSPHLRPATPAQGMSPRATVGTTVMPRPAKRR